MDRELYLDIASTAYSNITFRLSLNYSITVYEVFLHHYPIYICDNR